MLALDHRRQDNLYFKDHLSSPATQHPHLAFFSRIPYTTATPSPSDFNSGKTSSGYFESTPAFHNNTQPTTQSIDNDNDNDQYMSNNFSYSSPAIRLLQSTPTPVPQQSQSQSQSQSQLPFDSAAYAHLWNSVAGNSNMVATHALQQTHGINRNRAHHRAQSSSSIGSSGSASPFSQSHATYNYAVSESSPTVNTASKLGQSYNVDQSANSFSNHLPTPTQTPTQDSFMVSSYPNYNQQGGIESTVAAHLAMNNAIEEDLPPGMSHSGRQSLSSIGQEPSTPRTVTGDGYDDFKAPIHEMRQNFPKLDRTVSDAYQDELFNPSSITPSISVSTAHSKPSKQYLSPHRKTVAEALQQAQFARSQSPTSATSRGVSPFRPDSPYVQDAAYMRFGTASQARQQQKAQAEAAELSQHMAAQQDDQPKTISPKDAVLEYNETEEDAKLPLFPQSESAQFGPQFGAGGQQNYQAGGQGFSGGLDTSRAATWTNPRRQSASTTFSNTPISQPQQNAYNFASPSISGGMHGLPFSSQNYRATSSAAMTSPLKQEETPDFPAHLTSMESSASEAPASSSSTNNSNHTETQKPTSSLADTGTYTCTYHGCTLRFETPQKLQKHKREGHRNPAAGSSVSTTPGVGSGMTSAALMQRNSQAGPHKCERINPTTGKPCNTIFSRPYDLTRHEDTIHNARKQKVRCALCVEEKTFSRNDALTRHMRVVHPEVDFPGKHRRRGAHD